MKICVAGGGIFGCTAAIYLSRAGHDVHLYDPNWSLLNGASGSNQFRLHRGYHYPRSPETVRECLHGLATFREEYGEAILSGGKQYYAIAADGSKTSPEQFLNFCNAHGLKAWMEASTPITDDMSLLARVEEDRVDPDALRAIISANLRDACVKRYHSAVHARFDFRDQFDKIVVAAYANTNDVLEALGLPTERYRFQLVEKPIVQMPESFKDTSLVVLDGLFCCVDPLGETGRHVLGHVKEAVLYETIGEKLNIPPNLSWTKRWINQGQFRNDQTRLSSFVMAGEKYVPALADATYEGSFLTIRATLPDVSGTDARLTVVTQLDDQVIRVFSGKLGCAVDAAQKIVAILDETDGHPAMAS